MYKNILLAVDGSDNSLRATKEVVKIASLMPDCLIEVILVADFSKAKNEILHSSGKQSLEQSRRRRILPIEEELKAHQLNYKIKILPGEPGPTIVSYANKGPFDLVVIGSRGLNLLQEMVLGSVSHKVVKRVQVPVLIVK